MCSDGSDGNSGGAALSHHAAVSGAAGRVCGAAHRLCPCQGTAGDLRSTGGRQHDAGSGHPCDFSERGFLCTAGAGNYGRAAPLRRGTADTAGGQGRLPSQAGHVGNADSPHAGSDDLRRSGHFCPEGTAPRTAAGADFCSHRKAAAAGVQLYPAAAGTGASGLYCLPHDRRSGRERIAGSFQLCRVHTGRGVLCLSGGTAPRQNEAGREGQRDDGVPEP